MNVPIEQSACELVVLKTADIPMNVIRRPLVSLMGPQNEGAIPCTAMYIVIVLLPLAT